MQYIYLMWASIFLLVWLLLFIVRKDTRKEMLVISGLFGFGGLAAQKTNIQDWWQPLTITGTSIGVEDFLIGFAIGGIAAVAYEEIYRQRLAPSRSAKIRALDAGFYLLFFPLLYLILFFLIEMGSFYSVVLAYGVCLAYMLYNRADLLRDTIMSGFFMLILGSVVYWGMLLFHPTFITDFWYLPQKWYAELVLGIPIAEYIWFFLTGAYIGPLYEYINKLRFMRSRS